MNHDLYQIVPDLKYEYHDSICSLGKMDKEKSIQLHFDLYPIFYPQKTKVLMNLYGIFNFNNAVKYFSSKSHDDGTEGYQYIGRVDCIQYDTKKKSKPCDIYLFFEIDHYGHFTVHCKAVEIIRILE